MKFFKKNKKGFTVVELLLIMAIMWILAISTTQLTKSRKIKVLAQMPNQIINLYQKVRSDSFSGYTWGLEKFEIVQDNSGDFIRTSDDFSRFEQPQAFYYGLYLTTNNSETLHPAGTSIKNNQTIYYVQYRQPKTLVEPDWSISPEKEEIRYSIYDNANNFVIKNNNNNYISFLPYALDQRIYLNKIIDLSSGNIECDTGTNISGDFLIMMNFYDPSPDFYRVDTDGNLHNLNSGVRLCFSSGLDRFSPETWALRKLQDIDLTKESLLKLIEGEININNLWA